MSSVRSLSIASLLPSSWQWNVATLNSFTKRLFCAFIYQGGPLRVLYNVDSQEPATVHLLHLSFTDVDGGVCLCVLSTVHSLVLLTLSSRLLPVHHSARLLSFSWYKLSSLSIMQLMLVVSAAYLTIECSWCPWMGRGWAHSPGGLQCPVLVMLVSCVISVMGEFVLNAQLKSPDQILQCILHFRVILFCAKSNFKKVHPVPSVQLSLCYVKESTEIWIE